MFWWRHQYAQGRERQGSTLNRRGSELIGRQFALHDAIVGGRGKIRVADSLWLVSGPDLPAGTLVRVNRQDGALLLVEKV
ncbi:Inner membrane protein YbbJ [compost metagenome]